jgi:hypothetical protein
MKFKKPIIAKTMNSKFQTYLCLWTRKHFPVSLNEYLTAKRIFSELQNNCIFEEFESEFIKNLVH